MGESIRPDSPIDEVAMTVAPATAEAFRRLGNETRSAILLALWDAFEPFGEGDPISFSALRKRVGMRDGSQFNYHLDKLVGHFVRHVDDGYELLPAGLAIIWAIIAGTGLKDPAFEPAELDEPCPYCNGPVVLRYEDAHLIVVCTECEGNGSFDDRFPSGVLFFSTFEPTGLANRTPDEILDVCHTEADHADVLLSEGICPSCSGPVESELLVCDDHDSPPGVLCSTCNQRHAVLMQFTCTICKDGARRPPEKLVVWHPSVVSFYYDHIVAEEGRTSDCRSIFQLQREMHVRRPELVSEDPVRLRVTVECGGEELYLVLDEEIRVVDVSA